MAKKQFKSESKRLLDLMINSIYTHKEIFLRELISNASDAIDKLCYISLTDENVGLSRDDFKIDIFVNKEKRTLTISDNGVGMTANDLDSNLGVIARSGSLLFKKDMQADENKNLGDDPKGESSEDDGKDTGQDDQDEQNTNKNDSDGISDLDIIGQFGVGFYSAFMVASKVTVISRAYNDPEGTGPKSANKWVSSGSDGYTITSCEKDSPGTDIIIELKNDSDDEKYSKYLEEYTITSLIRKYSDYVRWPIYSDATKSREVETDEKDDKGEPKKKWESYTEREVVNSRIPIWQRAKSEVTDEECFEFYKEKFYDHTQPVSVIRIAAEGTVSYNAMLFIPAACPYDYFTREFKAGLQLYSSGIMIMEHCSDLLPEHFRFVRGVVESPDFSLNISREVLQHDRQLKVIASNIEKKIKAELSRLMENDPDKYNTFYKAFGIQLKYGIAGSYGMNRDMLSDLIMFYSSKAQKLIPISEYVKNMPEDQKFIYYAGGESISMLDKLPQAEQVRDAGYEIFYLTDEIDEFAVKTLGKFKEKEFRSVNDNDLGLDSDEDKEKIEKQETEHKDLLDFVKESLDGKVTAVRFSQKLKSYPVCLAAGGEISFEMEKYFNAMRSQRGAADTDEAGGDMLPAMRAERVLEINSEHSSFTVLKDAFDSDKERAANLSKVLYNEALLTAGMPLDDPAEFAALINTLLF
ncbi:MAG: molecular chaperone HtpG [Oscillospiraceae bacterium]|nr:molecular chaperone HtpG [Oscillospiraceae bacterium]